MLKRVMAALLIVLPFCLGSLSAAAGENAANKPAVLFCSPQGASDGWVDLDYLKELHEQGFEVDYTDGLKDITWEKIKNYNALVLYATPYSFEILNGNTKVSPDLIKPFVALMEKYIAGGGGVFLMPTECNSGVQQFLSDLTNPWGARLPTEIIEETDKTKVGSLSHANQDLPLAFTEQILPSPVSPGVKQIWYPISLAYNAQHTGPIVVDGNWQVVVKASKTSLTKPFDFKKSQLPGLENPFSRPGGIKEPDLFAIREYKGGRIALMNQWRQYSIGSGTRFIFDRQVLSKGVGDKPSDFGKLLENTYRWLAEPSLKSGAPGGYVTPPDRLLAPNANPKVKAEYADYNWPYDAAKLGAVTPPAGRKIFRGLLGAKTSHSTGQGTVKEYAKAAAAAGLDFVIFMDDFAKLTPKKLEQLKADCKKFSTEKIKLLPGFCIDNNIGNHLFFFSPNPVWIPADCLTGPDKKTLYMQQVDEKDESKFTGFATKFGDWVFGAYGMQSGQVGYYNFSGSPHGMRLWDLRYCAMAGVRYYKNGTLVEDNTADYVTTVSSTLPPIPASVNEVTTPEELKREVESGHSLIYAEASSLNNLFLEALRWTSPYDAPNVSLSDGPRVVAWPGMQRVWGLGGEDFVVGRSVMSSPLLVTSDKGLKEIRLYNGGSLYRRFLPNGAKEFGQTLVLDGNVQKNIALVAEDVEGKKTISFPRICWKDGALAIVICSDHVNEGFMRLCHGPYIPAMIQQPTLPDDIAGVTWDGGGALTSLSLTGSQNTYLGLDSDKGSEAGYRFDQIPFVESSDDGMLAVSSERKEVFDEKVLTVYNPWYTFGPIAGPARLLEYVVRYREYVRPTIGTPMASWAAVGVRAGANAALFREEITFKEDLKIKTLSLGNLTGNRAGFFVISGSDEKAPLFFELGQPDKGEIIKLKRGDWFGYYNTKVSNANLFFNRGETIRVRNGAPLISFEAEMDGKEMKKGQQYVYEIASLGFPVNVEIKSPADLMRYVRYLKEPTGLAIQRGMRVESPGLVEFAPDKQFVVELSIPKPAPRLDLTLPCRVQGLNPRWSAGLFQKQGYTKGDYGTGENRYRALGMDWAGNAYIPLYIDYASVTHILAGHPVIAGPEGKDLFIQVTHVAEKPDKWHVSVNNPTDQPVTTTLHKAMDLPGLDLPDTTLTLPPGAYQVIR